MKRFVSPLTDVEGNIIKYGIKFPIDADRDEYIQKVLKKLYELEELEYNRRLAFLPCAIGDTLYCIADEDYDGNDVPTVNDYRCEVIVITSDGFRFGDRSDRNVCINRTFPLGSRFASFSPDGARFRALIEQIKKGG
ncbi:MAG: hypothetical protein IJH37_05115 [Clostridia bacterium]|nr:hypothetical protein [Clostridia bacterium]